MSDNEILLPHIPKEYYKNRKRALKCMQMEGPVPPIPEKEIGPVRPISEGFKYNISITKDYPPFVGPIWTSNPKQLLPKRTPLPPWEIEANSRDVMMASAARKGIMSSLDANITNIPFANAFNDVHGYRAGINWAVSVYYTFNI